MNMQTVQSSVVKFPYDLFSDVLRDHNFTHIQLDEMPQIIPNLSKLEDLDIYSVNRSVFKSLRSQPKTIYHTFDAKHIVYTTGNEYFCLDYDKNKVSYYMKYKTGNDSTLGPYLWQSLVWRSKDDTYVIDLPHNLFFKKLLPKYGTVCTDGQQTPDGRKFWNYQITYALKHNINVYYYNLKSKELVKITDPMHFTKAITEYDIWGDSKQYQNKLMVITNHEMPRS